MSLLVYLEIALTCARSHAPPKTILKILSESKQPKLGYTVLIFYDLQNFVSSQTKRLRTTYIPNTLARILIHFKTDLKSKIS